TPIESTIASRRFFWLSSCCIIGSSAFACRARPPGPAACRNGAGAAARVLACRPRSLGWRRMQCRERRGEIALEGRTGTGCRRLPRDEPVVAARAGRARCHLPHSLLEAAADAIAGHGIAEF